MNKRKNTRVFLAVLTVVSAVFCYLLLAPFLKVMVFAAVLAVISYPLYAQVHRWVHSRDVAAALSTTVVAAFIASASVGLGSSITSGLRNIYRSLSSPGGATNTLTSYFSRIAERFVGVLSGYVPVSVADFARCACGASRKYRFEPARVDGKNGGQLYLADRECPDFVIHLVFFIPGRTASVTACYRAPAHGARAGEPAV